MRSKAGDMERFSTKLLGLSQILKSLEGPISDATSAELQQLIEGTQKVSQVSTYNLIFNFEILMIMEDQKNALQHRDHMFWDFGLYLICLHVM